MTFLLGHVEGEEIAATTFQRRTFAYFQIPIIEFQISGISRTDSTGALENYLITEKLISVTKVQTPPDESVRWDLVHASVNGELTSRGEAEILCNYLDSKNAEGKNQWVEWSKENPDLAKVVWPVVLSVSRQELYIFVPELLELAAGATDPDDLQNDLDASLADQYLRVATTQQQLKRHALAVELFTHCLDHSPNRIVALEGRATSFSELGNREKSDADSAQVNALKQS